MSRTTTVLPSASRLMRSLRDVGYDPPSAIADLVDNSIDAGASTVSIDVVFEGVDSWLRVTDDGAGMSPSILDEAMRYGSRRPYASADLGKYGLGLKTASLSQCRRLTVATRRSPQRCRLHVRRWDLDHVIDVDEWQLVEPYPWEWEHRLVGPLETNTGTVVLWEGLDRLLTYRRPDGQHARNALVGLTEQIAQHLGMTFHRLLAAETMRSTPLRILVNGERVEPWDPFVRSEPGTQTLAPQFLDLPGVLQPVVVRPFILPREEDFSSPAARDTAAGPKRWNRQQGLYIYRRDRVVQAGGWSRLRAEDEHTKLARISLDIPEDAEPPFGINVSKSRVVLPEAIRPQLRAVVSAVAAAAQVVYRGAIPGRREDDGFDPAWESAFSTDEPLLPAELVARALEYELRDYPEVLGRLVRALGLEAYLEDAPGLVTTE